MQDSRRLAGRMDRGVGAAIVSGLAYALAQPNWGLWPLAAFCMVPLFRALAGASPRRRIWLAYVFGTVAAGVATAVSGAVGAVAYFGLPLWAGGLAALAAGQLFGAGSFVLFAALAGDPLRHPPPLAALRIGAAWAAAEWVRSVLFTGLPWLLFAYALVPVPELAQAAALGGAFFVSLWLATFNAALALALTRSARRPAIATAAAIAAGLGGFGFSCAPFDDPIEPAPGSVRLATTAGAERSRGLRVLLVQAAVPSDWRNSSPSAVRALDQLVQLSTVRPGPDLVLWPENAVSALLPFNEGLLRNSLAPLGTSGKHLILGAPRADPQVPGRMLTSAFLLGPDRRLLAHHDKVHLLPFAEYVPWPLSRWQTGARQTSAGSRPTVLAAGATGVGPLLCYEVLFPELTRALVRDGAQVLVNLSNDAWFGTTGAVAQHLAGAVFRAIETRRPMLRSTNTGITAAIDGRGRIVGRLAMNRPGRLAVEVWPNRAITPYVRIGDSLTWCALAATGGLSLAEAATRRRRSRSDRRPRPSNRQRAPSAPLEPRRKD